MIFFGTAGDRRHSCKRKVYVDRQKTHRVKQAPGKLDAKFVEEKDWCQGSHRSAEAMALSSCTDSHVNTGNLTK
ncbi:hypothetical protein CapIbe_001010 [Capra ibex]